MDPFVSESQLIHIYTCIYYLFMPWEALLSKALLCECLIKYMGNPGKNQYFPGNLGKYRNEYNQHTVEKHLKFSQKLNVQIYVFYKHFLGCKCNGLNC